MYRSIWKAFFVLFFKPCLSTCFCLFKYSYCFYLILSHLTYKRKQMRMQTEIIISLMYSLILRETLLCWLWMPWLRNGTLQNRHSLSSQMCAWFVCVCVCACVCVCSRRKEEKKERKSNAEEWILETASSPIFVIYVGILALFTNTMNVKLKCMWLSRDVWKLADKIFNCHQSPRSSSSSGFGKTWEYIVER